MSEFETHTRNLLRESELTIDEESIGQLTKARTQALEKATRKPFIPSFLLPASGMALASFAAIVLIISPINKQNSIENEAYLKEGIELYEDLDFYQWLAEDETQLKG